MEFRVKIEGATEVIASLKQLAKDYPAATGAALYEEGLAIQAASQPLVPVDTGRLRASAYTSPPRHGSDGPEVSVGYGTDYAIPVHERLDVHHPTGQAKYLEVPFNAAMRGFASRLAARIEEHVEKGTNFAILGTPSEGS